MKKGFTLIEFVVTIAVLVALTGFSIPAFRQYGALQELEQSAEQVAETLREAQALSLAPEGEIDYYAVEFSPPDYRIVGHKTDSGDPGDIVFISKQTLAGKVFFEAFTPSQVTIWIFKVNDQGRISTKQGTEFTIRLHHDRLPSETKVIKGTAATGLIEIR